MQNTHISLFIIHIYSNKIFIFLTLWTVTVRGERKEKRVRWREEREKKNKKSFTWWTVTVYIYTVTVHLQDYCAYLDIFTKTDVRRFWIKMCKIEHFLYFNRLSMSWCDCSNCFKDSSCFSLFRRIQESQDIYASVTLLW